MRNISLSLAALLLVLALCVGCIDRTDWASKGPTDENYSAQLMVLELMSTEIAALRATVQMAQAVLGQR